MGRYIPQARTLTELDPPVVIMVNRFDFLKSVTVIVRTGEAHVYLGDISTETAVVKAGESVTWSALDAGDFFDPMTVSAQGTGAEVLLLWTHF